MEKKIFTFYAPTELTEELKQFIHPSEEIKFVVKTIRDIAIFTDKRVLIADKQGFSGKKVEYFTIPFSKIVTYAVETAGTFDLDSEIKLVLAGGIEIELRFMKEKTMNNLLLEVYHLINSYMLTH